MTDEVQVIRSQPGALRQAFGWPPFTVLDFANGEWQARKKAWVSLGLKGEVGRGENLLGFSDQIKSGAYGNGKVKIAGRLNGGGVGKVLDTDGSFWNKSEKNDTENWLGDEEAASEADEMLNDTSIFDPVLCELVYTWFFPAKGSVLDPFAGGPTRGIMAAKLGLEYHGHELRAEQVTANEHTANEILGLEEKDRVKWYQGDSAVTLDQWEDSGFDGLLTCPPYFNLEVYSDDPADISNMDDYEKFLEVYRGILHKAFTKLKDDTFAAIVVGNVRGKANGGAYHPLVSDTIRIAAIAGLNLYNEAIMKKPNGSAQFRARKQFTGSRKLVTCHEYLLVFCKGDPKKAVEKCGSIERFNVDDAVDRWV